MLPFHQLLALSLGAKTKRMHQGHRGANHPVKNLTNNKVEITSQTRDFLYIDDAVDALARAINKGGGLVINIGTGVQTTIKDLWHLVGRDTTLQESYESARTADLQRNAVNTTRARIQLGWSHWTTLEAGVSELLGRTV